MKTSSIPPVMLPQPLHNSGYSKGAPELHSRLSVQEYSQEKPAGHLHGQATAPLDMPVAAARWTVVASGACPGGLLPLQDLCAHAPILLQQRFLAPPPPLQARLLHARSRTASMMRRAAQAERGAQQEPSWTAQVDDPLPDR